MKDIFNYLAHDYARCLQRYDVVCDDVDAGFWQHASEELKGLSAALHRHIRIEEELIFTALQALVNSTDVPTASMRTEHARLISYLDQLCAAVQLQRPRDFAKFSSMFKVLMQLHFDKEHGRFYPLAACVLAPQRERLNAALDAFDEISDTVS